GSLHPSAFGQIAGEELDEVIGQQNPKHGKDNEEKDDAHFPWQSLYGPSHATIALALRRLHGLERDFGNIPENPDKDNCPLGRVCRADSIPKRAKRRQKTLRNYG